MENKWAPQSEASSIEITPVETFGINEADDLEQENLMESILINEDTSERDPQSKGPRLFSTTGLIHAKR